MPLTGVIIEESLADTSVLDVVTILRTEVTPVRERHRTPWVENWTMHTVEIPAERVAEIAERIRQALDREHQWYADFKSECEHYIIYRDKVFHITDRSEREQYDAASEYGIKVGIPDYQVDFSKHVTP